MTSATRPRRRLALALLGVALVGGGIAGATYKPYADEHLRPRPRVPSCLVKARAQLRKLRVATGTEPRETTTGETVYLSENEYRAVGCAATVSKELAGRLTEALAEIEPAPRATRVAAMMRAVPEDRAHDVEAAAAYMMAISALRPLPKDMPEVQAAREEVNRVYGCRFDTRLTCPTRPPIPALVWISGVPAAGAALGLLGLGVSAGASAIAARRRKARPPTPPPPP